MGAGSRRDGQVRGEGKQDPAWFCEPKHHPLPAAGVGMAALASFLQAVSG